MKPQRSVTFFANTPWARVEDSRISGWAWVQLFRDAQDRVRVGSVVVDQMGIGSGPRLPLTAETLRRLNLPDIEREANRISEQLVGLDENVEWSQAAQGHPIATIRQTLRAPGESLGVTVDVSILDDDGNRTVIQSSRSRRRFRLTYGPPPGRIPDEYLAQVVKAYHSAVEHGLYPAPTIAEDVGAQVNTVRSWIKKARARGLMAPGSRGQMG